MSTTNKFFNPDGSLRDGLVFGDPYRRQEGGPTIADQEFDEDGWPSELLQDSAHAVVDTAGALSLAAQIIHACAFAQNTEGYYSPNYYWRS